MNTFDNRASEETLPKLEILASVEKLEAAALVLKKISNLPKGKFRDQIQRDANDIVNGKVSQRATSPILATALEVMKSIQLSCTESNLKTQLHDEDLNELAVMLTKFNLDRLQ